MKCSWNENYEFSQPKLKCREIKGIMMKEIHKIILTVKKFMNKLKKFQLAV